jgi:glutamyl-tRNA synthetase/glutamyl-Q tRNA(Asp) synthetase
MDRLGNWTYQFAVTVDDFLQGVTLVIRGEDLLPSTGRQILLARLLGRSQPPAFFHHALIRKPGGEKLSKAAKDTGIRELRARGDSPEMVLGRAAHAVGLIPELRALPPAEISALFRAD